MESVVPLMNLPAQVKGPVTRQKTGEYAQPFESILTDVLGCGRADVDVLRSDGDEVLLLLPGMALIIQLDEEIKVPETIAELMDFLANITAESIMVEEANVGHYQTKQLELLTKLEFFANDVGLALAMPNEDQEKMIEHLPHEHLKLNLTPEESTMVSPHGEGVLLKTEMPDGMENQVLKQPIVSELVDEILANNGESAEAKTAEQQEGVESNKGKLATLMGELQQAEVPSQDIKKVDPLTLQPKENISVTETIDRPQLFTATATVQGTFEQNVQPVRSIEPMITSMQFIKQKNGDGLDEIRVKLKPQSLGEVVIKISREDGQVTGRILVESLLVKEVLESRLFQFKERLAEMNIEVKEVTVFLGNNPEQDKRWSEPPLWQQGHGGGGQMLSDGVEAAGRDKQSLALEGRLNILA